MLNHNYIIIYFRFIRTQEKNRSREKGVIYVYTEIIIRYNNYKKCEDCKVMILSQLAFCINL